MDDIISINDSIEDISHKLEMHGVSTKGIYMWEIMMYLTLNSFPNKKAKIVGFHDKAEFVEVP